MKLNLEKTGLSNNAPIFALNLIILDPMKSKKGGRGDTKVY
jgi:hypothetical protein